MRNVWDEEQGRFVSVPETPGEHAWLRMKQIEDRTNAVCVVGFVVVAVVVYWLYCHYPALNPNF